MTGCISQDLVKAMLSIALPGSVVDPSGQTDVLPRIGVSKHGLDVFVNVGCRVVAGVGLQPQ